MADELDTLVADADRARASNELREHYDSGRLTVDEFESRLGEVNSARTAGDLQQAFRQLPRKEPAVSLRPRDVRWRSLAVQYGVVNVICILVWAAGGGGDFWPKWVLVFTLALYLRRVTRRGARRT
jgi:hypothetical protein